MHKVFCLLSGGVDSSTALSIAAEEFPDDPIEAVTIDYGQRHKKEAECAATQAEAFSADHVVIPVGNLLQGMLVDKGANNEAIPEKSYAELPEGISPTYVTFRNGFMLSVLAARAQAWVMQMEKLQADDHGHTEYPEATIYMGVHADDGVNWAYPDCTPEFIGPMSAAIHVGTYNKVRLRAPLLYMTKPQVVEQGSKRGVDYANTWSCYKGKELHCGKCPTCLSRKEAFELNGLSDPTEYAA
jgi:7-cyano-7-deazaguanine synthase